MPIKALVVADLHLGRSSSCVPVTTEESSTRSTWSRIINWSIAHHVDMLLLTGDVVDRENRFFEAIGPLKSGFEKLKKVGIEVYMVAGNHDFDTLADVLKSAELPNVHLLGARGTWEIKWFEKNSEKIQLIGWSFPSKHVQHDPLHSYNIAVDPGHTAIGLLHGDVGNMAGNYGRIDYANFLNKGIDAWLLGHIHKPAVLQLSDPFIVYPGSPHALSPKEQGAHGALILEITSPHDITHSVIHFSPVLYETIDIDISGVADKSMFRTHVIAELNRDATRLTTTMGEVAYLLYSVRLIGQHDNIQELEQWKIEVIEQAAVEMPNGTNIYVRGISIDVEPAIDNLDVLAKQDTPVGILANAILSMQRNTPNLIVDDLILKMKSSIRDVNSAPAYRSLHPAGRLEPDTDDVCKNYLLKECNKMISTLLMQTR